MALINQNAVISRKHNKIFEIYSTRNNQAKGLVQTEKK